MTDYRSLMTDTRSVYFGGDFVSGTGTWIVQTGAGQRVEHVDVHRTCAKDMARKAEVAQIVAAF